MTRSIAPFQAGELAPLGDLAAGLDRIVSTTLGRGSGDPILRMGRDGVWIYGPENIEAQEGSHWAVNPLSFEHGYVAWKRIPGDTESKPEMRGEAMVGAGQAKPDKATLPVFVDATWEEQITCQMRCLDGEDEGTQVVYKAASIGGREALLRLIRQVAERARSGETAVVPSVELLSGTYLHRSYGKVYTPLLNIVDWLGFEAAGRDGVSPPVGKPPEPTPEPEPTIPVHRRGAPVVSVAKPPPPAPARSRPPVAPVAAEPELPLDAKARPAPVRRRPPSPAA